MTATDPAGKWKTQETDALGNLIKVTEPRSGGGTPYETNYTYNEFGKLLTVSMARPGVGSNPATVTQTRTWVQGATTPEGSHRRVEHRSRSPYTTPRAILA